MRCSNTCNYADTATVFVCHPTLETIIRQLEIEGTLVEKWFSYYYLKLNHDKCHHMIFGDKYSKATVAIRTSAVNESENGKMLRITFDKKLGFRKHVEQLLLQAFLETK